MSAVERVVVASDFHLHPDRPEGIALFRRFLDEAVAGADRLLLLGDLFDYWFGRRQLALPGFGEVFDALGACVAAGCAVDLYHGNRDFLLGRAEADRCGARVVGEERVEELFGRRILFLHGDSLCTADRGYQRTKPWLRSPFTRALARVLPAAWSQGIARRLRSASMRSVASKPRAEMDIQPDAVRRRVAEGADLLVCGHVHVPGVRDCGEVGGRPARVVVLSDWGRGGVYAVVDGRGVGLVRFPDGAEVAPPA